MGLLAAHGAVKRVYTRIILLDRAREFAKVGRVLFLQPNGVRVLKITAPNIHERLEAFHPTNRYKFMPMMV